MKPYFLLPLLLLFVGCSEPKIPLQSVPHVAIQKYLGTWHEIARYEHFFEKGCVDVTATYALKENGTIDVLNRCTTGEGEKKEARGEAYAVDTSNSRLKVTFFWPFYGDYWIIELDDAYEYALIGEPSREYFWILSRAPALEPKRLEEILARLPHYGYDAKKLIFSPQQKHR